MKEYRIERSRSVSNYIKLCIARFCMYVLGVLLFGVFAYVLLQVCEYLDK